MASGVLVDASAASEPAAFLTMLQQPPEFVYLEPVLQQPSERASSLTMLQQSSIFAKIFLLQSPEPASSMTDSPKTMLQLSSESVSFKTELQQFSEHA